MTALLLLAIGSVAGWLAAAWIFRRFGTAVGIAITIGAFIVLALFPPAIVLAAPFAVADIRHRIRTRIPPREIPRPGDDQIGER